jgi:hypothetical protein
MKVHVNEYEPAACIRPATIQPFSGYFVGTFSTQVASECSQTSDGNYTCTGFCADLVGSVLDNLVFGNAQYQVQFHLSTNIPPDKYDKLTKVTYNSVTYTIPWDKINWVLNQYPIAPLPIINSNSWLDVQAAIWSLVHNGCPQGTLPDGSDPDPNLFACDPVRTPPYYFPYGTTYYYGPFGCPPYPYGIIDKSIVAGIVADANSNGGGFKPEQPGQFVAVIVEITSCTGGIAADGIDYCGEPYQIIFIPVEIPVPSQAAATVTLDNLTQTYTGSPLTPTATTDPAGLTIVWSGAPQTNAGSYPVTATVSDTNYQGSASGTFTINKAAATVTLSNLTHTYDGNPKYATATTNPSGLSGVTITYDGSSTAPTNAGSYAVVASLTNANYQANNATGTLVIGQANQATLTVNAGTPLTYNTTETLSTSGGSGGGAVTYTVTSGSCSVSGNQLTANSGTGTCSVTATKAADTNYNQATSVAATVTLQKAAATVTLSNLTQTYTGSPLTPTATTNTTGLTIVWSGAPQTNVGS